MQKKPFRVFLVGRKEVAPITVLDVSVGPSLTEEAARQNFAQGEEAVAFALLSLAKPAKLAKQKQTVAADSPSTPSGMKPVFTKPTTPRRRKKLGRPPGHPGTRRPTPTKIDKSIEHRADVCPDCGGPLHRCQAARRGPTCRPCR